MAIKRIEPKPGQESVWDYPRPPRVELAGQRVRVVFAGEIIAESEEAWRVLETSHPPTIYVPPSGVRMRFLLESSRRSGCEWKGTAHYFHVRVGDAEARDAAWSYPNPVARFAAIAGCIAFYPSRMDACFLDEEQVVAQPGDFYGGWITGRIVGPFKGAPGSWGW